MHHEHDKFEQADAGQAATKPDHRFATRPRAPIEPPSLDPKGAAGQAATPTIWKQFEKHILDNLATHQADPNWLDYDSPARPSLDPKGDAGKLKPQLQLIPPISNVEMAKALKHGADRYGPWNWRTANVESMTYIGAIKRHLDAYLDGQDLDESGAHHLGHIAASCAILLDAGKFGTLVDNRPPTPKMDYSAHPLRTVE